MVETFCFDSSTPPRSRRGADGGGAFCFDSGSVDIVGAHRTAGRG